MDDPLVGRARQSKARPQQPPNTIVTTTVRLIPAERTRSGANAGSSNDPPPATSTADCAQGDDSATNEADSPDEEPPVRKGSGGGSAPSPDVKNEDQKPDRQEDATPEGDTPPDGAGQPSKRPKASKSHCSRRAQTVAATAHKRHRTDAEVTEAIAAHLVSLSQESYSYSPTSSTYEEQRTDVSPKPQQAAATGGTPASSIDKARKPEQRAQLRPGRNSHRGRSPNRSKQNPPSREASQKSGAP